VTLKYKVPAPRLKYQSAISKILMRERKTKDSIQITVN
jgi:hypothetical protein